MAEENATFAAAPGSEGENVAGDSRTPDLYSRGSDGGWPDQIAATARAAMRRNAVAELRIRGLSYRKIGKIVGVSHKQVCEDWHTFLAENKPADETIEQYRAIQQERYEERISSARTVRERLSRERTVDVADFARLQAVENQSEEGLRRLLGTDQPVRVAHEGSVGIEVDGSLEITAADWERALDLRALMVKAKELLPAAFEDPVIDVEAVVPASNGNGNGHG